MTKKKQHIAFTGGGTGGHIQPIVSLLEYAKKYGFDKHYTFFWFGEKNSQEERAANTIGYIVFVPIFSGKWRRYWSIGGVIHNTRDIFKVIIGFFQSLRWFKKYKIQILFCKGGYVALPVSFAAKILKIKILMHESDTSAGLVNRLVAKFAERIFTGFPGVFPKARVVGQILSGQLGQRKTSTIQHEISLDKRKTTVLVMGGSQGAARIFDILLEILKTEACQKIQFLILLGTKNGKYKTLFHQYNNVYSFDFLSQQDISYIYMLSDIVITRGSATSLAEQQIFGLKKIVVPFPFTGGNHQFYNAIQYSEKYGDILVEQNGRMQENIESFLCKLKGFKKSREGVDQKQLEKAKVIIWQEINYNFKV